MIFLPDLRAIHLQNNGSLRRTTIRHELTEAGVSVRYYPNEIRQRLDVDVYGVLYFKSSGQTLVFLRDAERWRVMSSDAFPRERVLAMKTLFGRSIRPNGDSQVETSDCRFWHIYSLSGLKAFIASFIERYGEPDEYAGTHQELVQLGLLE